MAHTTKRKSDDNEFNENDKKHVFFWKKDHMIHKGDHEALTSETKKLELYA